MVKIARFLLLVTILLCPVFVAGDSQRNVADNLWSVCPDLLFPTWQRHVDEGARYIAGVGFFAIMYGVDVPEVGAAETARWYRTAAEQGFAFAQFSLGAMHVNGTGVIPQDREAAVRWFRLAAEQGYGLAQYNLGVMYAGGIGVVQNNVHAYAWLSIGFATHGGRSYSRRARNCVAKGMSQCDIASADDLSHSYWNYHVLPFFSAYRELCGKFGNDSECR